MSTNAPRTATGDRPLPGLVAAGLLLLLSLSSAGAQKLLQPEDVANLPEVLDAQISPGGTRVAYVQRVPRAADEETGPSYSRLWVVATDGGEAIPFTSPKGYATRPRWSSDGRSIAFLDKRGVEKGNSGSEPKNQIFVIPVDGGEARRITEAEEGVSEYAWHPRGGSIYFTSKDPKTEERKEAEKHGRDWQVVDRDYRHLRLYRVDLESEEAEPVTEAALTLRGIAPSPDGRRIAALAAPTPKVDDSYVFLGLVTVDTDSGAVNTVWDMPGKAEAPRWSPDGKWLACRAGIAAHDPLPGSLYLVPAEGGEGRNLTPDYPGSVYWFDFASPREILFAAVHGTQTHLKRIAIDGGSEETLAADGPVYTTAHLSRSGERLVTVASTPQHPREVFVRSLEQGGWTRLTSSYPHLVGFPLGRQEVIEWQARDGLRIEGILIYPLDYEEGKAYPLVIGVHGGPESAIRNGWNGGYGYLSQLLAHRSSLFLMPNYRGSAGRGAGFLLADHGEPAGLEFQDVLDGLEALIVKGMVDPERVGIMGGSYGGYFSAWGATKESRWFKAAVVNFGVTNLFSDWAVGDIPWEHRLVHWGWFPVDRPLLAMDRSPVTHVRNSRTATLIMHGKSDARVPPSQSWELYQGLRLNEGLPVELVLFPRERHGYREAPHRLEACRRALDWFTRHLGLAPAEATGGR